MNSIRVLQTIGLFALLGVTARAHDKNAPLNDAQKSYLSQYEAVRAALSGHTPCRGSILEKDLYLNRMRRNRAAEPLSL